MTSTDYLRHSDVLSDPAKKDDTSHSNYKFKRISATVNDLVMDNVRGHQVIPGEFQWITDEDGMDAVRRKVCWRSGNVIILEFDKDVPYHTLEDVIEDDEFIRTQAYALTHSVSSYYNGNGLRYRAWFSFSYNNDGKYDEESVKFKLGCWEFAKDYMLKRYSEDQTDYPVADRSGSNLTVGAYGLKGAKHIILGNDVGLEYRKELLVAFKEWEKVKDAQRYDEIEADGFSDLPDHIIKSIEMMDFGTNGWSKTYLPCMFGGNHDNDDIDPKMSVSKHTNGYTFYCLKCTQKRTYRRHLKRNDIIRKIREGTMPHLSLSRPQSKLEIERKDLIYSTIEKNREAIKAFLESDTRVLGIALETGGGKTEAALKYADESAICLVLPTHKLASDIEKRVKVMHFDDYKIWRSRFYNYEKGEDDVELFEDDLPPDNYFALSDKMCVLPNKCKLYRDKGGDVVRTICANCFVYEDCRKQGYLSQFDTFHQYKVQIITMKDLFTNPNHTTFAKKLIGDIDRVAFVDEAKAHDFYNTTYINKTTISNLAKIWQGKELGEVCDFIIEHWDDDTEWHSILKVPDLQHQEIMHQLSSVRCFVKSSKQINDDEHISRMFYIELHGLFDMETVFNTYAFMPKNDEAFDYLLENGQPVLYAKDSGVKSELTLSLDQCVKLNIISLDKWSTVPRVFDAHENWYTDLGRSVEHYGKLIRMEGSTETVILYATPPVIVQKLDKFVAMSATLDQKHFMKVFAGYTTQFLTRPPTEFNPEARFFQLRTGTTPVGYWIEDGEFAKHALFKLEILESKMEAEPDNKYGIITSQNIINLRKDVWADMEPFIEYTHFGSTEGLNEFFKEIDTVIIIGSFQLPPSTIVDRSMLIFGDESKELSFKREKDKLNNTHYIDERVQSVQDQAILGELIQDIGRGRLNLFPKRVILLSSYNIPTYSSRAHLFDMADLEVAHTFSDLETVITHRESEETQLNEKEALALKMYHQRKSNEDVIRETGLSAAVLRKLQKKYHIVIDDSYQRQIEGLLADKKQATLSEIVNYTNVSARNIQYHLNKMVKSGMIARVSYGVYKYGK